MDNNDEEDGDDYDDDDIISVLWSHWKYYSVDVCRMRISWSTRRVGTVLVDFFH
jgi:hypothetical protein